MSDDGSSRKSSPADARRERLAAELRANLHKRKALARARSARNEPVEDTDAGRPREAAPSSSGDDDA